MIYCTSRFNQIPRYDLLMESLCDTKILLKSTHFWPVTLTSLEVSIQSRKIYLGKYWSDLNFKITRRLQIFEEIYGFYDFLFFPVFSINKVIIGMVTLYIFLQPRSKIMTWCQPECDVFYTFTKCHKHIGIDGSQFQVPFIGMEGGRKTL